MRISDWSSDVCSSDLGPGQMIAVDLKEGRLYHDRELKDKVAALRPFGKWQKKITSLDGVLRSGRGEKAVMAREALRRRQGIGRASGRERVCQYVSISGDAVTFKKKEKKQTRTK